MDFFWVGSKKWEKKFGLVVSVEEEEEEDEFPKSDRIYAKQD